MARITDQNGKELVPLFINAKRAQDKVYMSVITTKTAMKLRENTLKRIREKVRRGGTSITVADIDRIKKRFEQENAEDLSS